ncbi:MAG: hypothetical protein HZB38_16970 [Planctomycetes bacterium]|nr:hypothetical protein [Planctomycetota bacterium]
MVFKDDFRPTNYQVDQIRQQIANRKVLYASNAVNYTNQLLEKLNAAYRALPKSNMLQVSPAAAVPAAPPAAAAPAGNAGGKKKP